MEHERVLVQFRRMDIITNTGYTQVAEGQTGTEVAGIINTAQGYIYGTERYEFSQEDISNDVLNYVHKKETKNIMAKLYDNNWTEQLTAGLFTLVSGNEANEWELSVPNAITGTWKLVITYLP
jgi:hypothetical protein